MSRDPIWDALKEVSKQQTQERRELAMAKAREIDDGGWTKHTEYHWQRKVDGEILDYWPSTAKYRYKGKTQNGHPLELLK